jgi:hypothetical protein
MITNHSLSQVYQLFLEIHRFFLQMSVQESIDEDETIK